MSPVEANKARFSTLLEMYISKTIMSFRKILSLQGGATLIGFLYELGYDNK